MRYTALVVVEGTREVYEVEGVTPYQARVEAALNFIKKYKLPGRPYHLLRDGCISLQTHEDKRVRYETQEPTT